MNQVEQALSQMAPGRYDTYEQLLEALTGAHVWMLLWQGQPGSPDAQYGNMDVAGWRYAPAFTSEEQMRASGWDRSFEVCPVTEIASSLYTDHWGLWLNPHAQGGGVGVPYLDLRRIVGGLDRLMAGPLEVGEPTLWDPAFYAVLGGLLFQTQVVRAAHRAWVRPTIGPERLVIGLRLTDNQPATMQRMRDAMARASEGAPAGLTLSSVALDDPFDPVAAWMRDNTRPFIGIDMLDEAARNRT
ncbi:enhanced serine sensitivity protein SseB C-terminal domain-containing protein [Embleya sp. NBC_00896]|uniref:enhanced serine sensitivity protein SseB C-terminal domain-containing protein n=1 Tax=Embleya sp. NBC_00896 TaxID=2975961 RepID=UPI0038648F7B|nr:enhanced serine sensitivity protein SseB [Embleya sp. NBC_00896]